MEWLILVGAVVFIIYLMNKKTDTPEVVKSTPPTMPIQRPPIPKNINIKQTDIEDIKLNDEQEKIFQLLETTNDIFYVTGKAGTGKSVLLRYFVSKTKKNVVVVAPTGVASLNVGGQTIHSFFRMPFDIDLENIEIAYKTKELLKHIDAIVIDEVSMVRVDLMEAISIKLQKALNKEIPFGGVQVIMFGDLYQLPPVVTDGQLKKYFDHNFGGHYFFNSPSIVKTNLKNYELCNVFRQKDQEFKDILDAIRKGDVRDTELDKLNERAKAVKPESGYLTLAGKNTTVSDINHKMLNNLSGNEKVYEAEIYGKLTESFFPTDKTLKLKSGAQVMLLKNDTEKPRRWVNGTIGVVSAMEKDFIKVRIDGVDHSISKTSWDKIQYEYDSKSRKLEKHIVSSFKQFPLRLAWAMTIHKSQGQTYQTVAIDLSGGAFAHGQTYVALSRCVSLDGLYLDCPVNRNDIIVDGDIISFMSKAINYN
jgi:ATP-dependent exoDNAse (exonuclease V) alpha subunit